ncbi:peptidylprolyl isomerase [Mesonia sp. K7]|uniref:peptidylprolyl isomerase n=1 Tax=Mesonia sp. K7 TaxID=2218606 RepID=UPI000DA76A82|nr:peptidylprolyl isomerase [Mesonia sp. K7]PZD77879.1 peptidylprolyl isomerase [Mesonia sp. K7]
MKKFLGIAILLVSVGLSAQDFSKERLLSIDGKPVYADEFIRVFSKNLDIIEQDEKDIDDYLDLFIDYKLKVLQAEEEQLDTLPSFTGEFQMYKSQLASKYIKNSEVTEKILQEAYQRKLEDINASHILINARFNDAPADTLKAYQKALEARKEILSGKDFAEVARKYSEDPSVRQNGGELGWFTVFNMVYPFESGAYETKKGEVSMPVRTRFGYHLIKVNDRRKAEGTVKVAHIMIKENEDSSTAKTQIEQIKKQLDEGADFSALAKQYSDDKNTARLGGKMNSFSKGKLKSEPFENQAFALKNIGDVSEPFKTDFGWHVVKLLEKNPIQSYEEEKRVLENQMKTDSRAQVIEEDILAKAKAYFTLKEDQSALKYFQKNVDERFFTNNWEPNKLDLPEKNVIEINGEGKTYADFANYLVGSQSFSNKNQSIAENIERFYQNYKDDFYKTYYKNNLAEVNEDYKYVLEEYRNGLLLYDLMNKKVWSKAKEDTLALKKYYDQHQKEYFSNATYELVIASTSDKKLAKKVRKMMKKQLEVSTIEDKLKAENKSVIFKSGTFTEEDSSLPHNFKAKKGVSKVYENNGVFVVLDINAIQPSQPINFEDATGKVIADYQEEIEKSWLENLRQQHRVEVNQDVLKKVKTKFENL